MKHSVEELLGADWNDEFEVIPDPYGFEPLSEAEREMIAQLLPPAEVARLLGLSRSRVDQLMKDGTLPVIWIGMTRLMLRRNVARYAEVHGLPRLAPRRKWKRIDLSAQPPTNDDA